MRRSVRALGIAVAVTVLIASSGTIGLWTPAGAAGTDTSVVDEAGSVRRARVREAGVTFEYPRHWVRTAISEEQARKILQKLMKSNPDVAKVLDIDDIVETAKSSKFRAVDVEAQLAGGAGGVVDVQVVDAPLPSIAEFRLSYGMGLSTAGIHLIDARKTKVSHRDALRGDARATLTDLNGNPVTMRLSQLLVDRGSTTTLVNVGMPDGPDADATIDAILSSVRSI